MADSDSVSEGPSSEGVSPSSRSKDAIDRFISLWEEMASAWGINRTMARIHALLYCVERPLDTDEIMDRLDVSRGNANMNLRSLVDWDLVRKVDRPGSRKDHYEAEKDVWHITARIIERRHRKEVQPVREQLEGCADLLTEEGEEIEERPDAEHVLHRRFGNLIELMEMFEGVAEVLLPLVENRDIDRLRRLIELGRAFDASRTDVSEELE